MKKLVVLLLGFIMLFSFTACGSGTDLSVLEERIAQLEQDKADLQEQLDVLNNTVYGTTSVLALGTPVNVVNNAGIILFTINCTETDTHWVVTVTNINVYNTFNANQLFEVDGSNATGGTHGFNGFPDTHTPRGSTASAYCPRTSNTVSIIISNDATNFPYAIYKF